MNDRRDTRPLLVLLAVHAVLLGLSGIKQSPTLDEPGQLVAGLSHWQTGSFNLYRVDPPLIRTVASLPIAISGYRLDWGSDDKGTGSDAVFDLGEDFVHVHGRSSLWIMTWARWACIPLSLLGGWICFRWAGDLFGRAAGYLACGLWCFSPLLLGHASLIAPDAHATALGLAACYTFWQWLKRPTWTRAILAGGVLGLAELAKTTMILFYPLWPLLWFLYRLPQRADMTRQRWLREAGVLGSQLAVSICVLNLGYLGEGSMTRLGNFEFVSELFAGAGPGNGDGGNRFERTIFASIPVPLPRNYILGIDIQQKAFEGSSRPWYLRRHYRSTGWWYYYPYAVLVKTPVGTMGLMVLALAIRFTKLRPHIHWTDAMVLLAPAVIIFSAAVIKSKFSNHVRYILPCLPFVFIWASQLAVFFNDAAALLAARRLRDVTANPLNDAKQIATEDITVTNTPRGGGAYAERVKTQWIKSALGIAAAALLIWSVINSLWVYPHSISYFNELVRGPRNGPLHLLDSNVDWGQDLLFLEKWNQRTAGELPVYLAFYNHYNPFDLEIARLEPWPFEQGVTDAKPRIAAGYYAVSVNLLYDFPWRVYGRDGRRYRIDQRPMAYLRSIEPVARAGYSIRIFSAQQLRAAYEYPQAQSLWGGATNPL